MCSIRYAASMPGNWQTSITIRESKNCISKSATSVSQDLFYDHKKTIFEISAYIQKGNLLPSYDNPLLFTVIYFISICLWWIEIWWESWNWYLGWRKIALLCDYENYVRPIRGFNPNMINELKIRQARYQMKTKMF